MQLKQIEKSEPNVQFVKTSQRAKAKHQKHADKPEYRDCKYCGKSNKRGTISVVLMEKDAPSVINFIILLMCVSLGKVASNLQALSDLKGKIQTFPF